MSRYELDADTRGLGVRYPATPTTREDASGWYATHTAAEERALYEEHAMWDAMDAARGVSL